MSEELSIGKYKVRIKSGANVYQDHAFSTWPELPRDASRFATPFADMIFDGQWDGKSWTCRAPGFGIIGGGDAYGNGALMLYGADSVEVMAADTPVTDCRRAASTIPASEAGELPEPVAYVNSDYVGCGIRTGVASWVGAAPPDGTQLFTATQIRAALASTRTASDTQSAALQEAARLCDAADKSEHPSDLADRIRALAAGEAECDAAPGHAAPAGQHDAFPAVLFDGKAVYDEISARLGKGHCFSADAVSATLDAVVRLIRRTASTDAAAGAAAGGNTCKESVTSNSAKNGTESPETRMDTGSRSDVNSAAEVDVEAERKRFESWMVNEAKIIVGSTDPYPAGLERDYWRVWQAAARTQADAGKDAARPSPPREKQ